ncbi:hypothetical protein PYCC9005_005182 [Savitreella phatthalungensis]
MADRIRRLKKEDRKLPKAPVRDPSYERRLSSGIIGVKKLRRTSQQSGLSNGDDGNSVDDNNPFKDLVPWQKGKSVTVLTGKDAVTGEVRHVRRVSKANVRLPQVNPRKSISGASLRKSISSASPRKSISSASPRKSISGASRKSVSIGSARPKSIAVSPKLGGGTFKSDDNIIKQQVEVLEPLPVKVGKPTASTPKAVPQRLTSPPATTRAQAGSPSPSSARVASTQTNNVDKFLASLDKTVKPPSDGLAETGFKDPFANRPEQHRPAPLNLTPTRKIDPPATPSPGAKVANPYASGSPKYPVASPTSGTFSPAAIRASLRSGSVRSPSSAGLRKTSSQISNGSRRPSSIVKRPSATSDDMNKEVSQKREIPAAAAAAAAAPAPAQSPAATTPAAPASASAPAPAPAPTPAPSAIDPMAAMAAMAQGGAAAEQFRGVDVKWLLESYNAYMQHKLDEELKAKEIVKPDPKPPSPTIDSQGLRPMVLTPSPPPAVPAPAPVAAPAVRAPSRSPKLVFGAPRSPAPDQPFKDFSWPQDRPTKQEPAPRATPIVKPAPIIVPARAASPARSEDRTKLVANSVAFFDPFSGAKSQTSSPSVKSANSPQPEQSAVLAPPLSKAVVPTSTQLQAPVPIRQIAAPTTVARRQPRVSMYNLDEFDMPNDIYAAHQDRQDNRKEAKALSTLGLRQGDSDYSDVDSDDSDEATDLYGALQKSMVPEKSMASKAQKLLGLTSNAANFAVKLEAKRKKTAQRQRKLAERPPIRKRGSSARRSSPDNAQLSDFHLESVLSPTNISFPLQIPITTGETSAGDDPSLQFDTYELGHLNGGRQPARASVISVGTASSQQHHSRLRSLPSPSAASFPLRATSALTHPDNPGLLLNGPRSPSTSSPTSANFRAIEAGPPRGPSAVSPTSEAFPDTSVTQRLLMEAPTPVPAQAPAEPAAPANPLLGMGGAYGMMQQQLQQQMKRNNSQGPLPGNLNDKSSRESKLKMEMAELAARLDLDEIPQMSFELKKDVAAAAAAADTPKTRSASQNFSQARAEAIKEARRRSRQNRDMFRQASVATGTNLPTIEQSPRVPQRENSPEARVPQPPSKLNSQPSQSSHDSAPSEDYVHRPASTASSRKSSRKSGEFAGLGLTVPDVPSESEADTPRASQQSTFQPAPEPVPAPVAAPLPAPIQRPRQESLDWSMSNPNPTPLTISRPGVSSRKSTRDRMALSNPARTSRPTSIRETASIRSVSRESRISATSSNRDYNISYYDPSADTAASTSKPSPVMQNDPFRNLSRRPSMISNKSNKSVSNSVLAAAARQPQKSPATSIKSPALDLAPSSDPFRHLSSLQAPSSHVSARKASAASSTRSALSDTQQHQQVPAAAGFALAPAPNTRTHARTVSNSSVQTGSSIDSLVNKYAQQLKIASPVPQQQQAASASPNLFGDLQVGQQRSPSVASPQPQQMNAFQAARRVSTARQLGSRTPSASSPVPVTTPVLPQHTERTPRVVQASAQQAGTAAATPTQSPDMAAPNNTPQSAYFNRADVPAPFRVPNSPAWTSSPDGGESSPVRATFAGAQSYVPETSSSLARPATVRQASVESIVLHEQMAAQQQSSAGMTRHQRISSLAAAEDALFGYEEAEKRRSSGRTTSTSSIPQLTTIDPTPPQPVQPQVYKSLEQLQTARSPDLDRPQQSSSVAACAVTRNAPASPRIAQTQNQPAAALRRADTVTDIRIRPDLGGPSHQRSNTTTNGGLYHQAPAAASAPKQRAATQMGTSSVASGGFDIRRALARNSDDEDEDAEGYDPSPFAKRPTGPRKTSNSSFTTNATTNFFSTAGAPPLRSQTQQAVSQASAAAAQAAQASAQVAGEQLDRLANTASAAFSKWFG